MWNIPMLPESKAHHREVLKPVEFWVLTPLAEPEEEDGRDHSSANNEDGDQSSEQGVQG